VILQNLMGWVSTQLQTKARSQPSLPILAAFTLVVFHGLLGIGCAGSDDSPKPFDPTDRYETRDVEGWTILVNKGLLANQPELAERSLTLLKFQLYQIARRLPPTAVEKLKRIKIWLEENEPHNPCMVYHPGAGWLKGHGMNPDKAKCVEIANAGKFLAWTFDQPWMVLHELSHGYHDQFLKEGFGNQEVKAAFEKAMKTGHYNSVLQSSGREEKAYATTNPMEYFAEATEAYFGTNDFYPFVRPELKKQDPELFALLEKLWGD
jgi:hypothetical protein